MKSYNVKVWYCNEHHNVIVNIPTPLENQASSNNGHTQVIIAHDTHLGKSEYFLAVFEKQTDEVLVNLGFIFKMQAEITQAFTGVNARKDVISSASKILAGYSY